MTIVVVPFHQDEHLSADHLPIPAGHAARVVEPGLPDTGRWPRLVALHDAVADHVATTPTAHPRPGSASSFDAHGDLHTLESSTSGYLGGLSLRLVLGAHPDRLAGPLGLRPLTEDRAVLVDARDLDPAEADFLATA